MKTFLESLVAITVMVAFYGIASGGDEPTKPDPSICWSAIVTDRYPDLPIDYVETETAVLCSVTEFGPLPRRAHICFSLDGWIFIENHPSAPSKCNAENVRRMLRYAEELADG